MEPHTRGMLIYWPPVVGAAGLALARPVGLLVFGATHPPGDVVALLLALAVAPLFALVSIVAAVREPAHSRAVANRSRRTLLAVYVADALLISTPAVGFLFLQFPLR